MNPSTFFEQTDFLYSWITRICFSSQDETLAADVELLNWRQSHYTKDQPAIIKGHLLFTEVGEFTVETDEGRSSVLPTTLKRLDEEDFSAEMLSVEVQNDIAYHREKIKLALQIKSLSNSDNSFVTILFEASDVKWEFL